MNVSLELKKLLSIALISALVPCTTFSQNFTWPTSTAENVGMNQQNIDAAIEQIESGTVGNIRSLIIIKDGQLITEKYFGNSGQKRPVYSVTKSIGSALLGIAQHQGATISTTDSIMSYLPQYNDLVNQQLVNEVSLHNLLTQRHGYNWDEWSTPFSNPINPVNQMLRTIDWYRFVLNAPITEAPDQNFTYSTGHSSLMSPILKNRTGRDVYEFAETELFVPLNISDTHWELVNGGGNQGSGTSNFPFGLEPMGFGLWLKPIDMAKFGELYRLGGLWQNNRLLSEQWIEQSIARYSDSQTDSDVFSTPFQGYGYQWWITQITDSTNRPTDMYYANGYGGQFIFVIPQYQAVIVTTANDFFYEGPNVGTVLRENLLLAFITDTEQSIPVTSEHNGSWYFPEHNGQGINFEIINDGNSLAGYWYTYDPIGGKQRWFTLQGEITNGTADFTIYSTAGGGFVDSQQIDLIEWGQGTLAVYDCSTGHFTFETSADNTEENTSGEFPLSRITASTGACSENNKKGKLSMGYELR